MDEGLITRMRDQTMDVQSSKPDQFASFIESERQRWRPVAQHFAGTM
jgi:tripartite-type tricarboxylate transporter receptor subunit TctC